ncbi:MAG: hypothetical protein CMJ85_06290 [Planctomycetes bacterium]|nr:hypothetical protein [Planctomycetota bacterium]MDP6423955.1 hypothetical protein [Planctomycetota bacterium]
MRLLAGLGLLTGTSLVAMPAAQIAATEAEEPSAGELGFIERLDEAWASANPARVLALFKIHHPQVATEIAWRIRSTAVSGKTERQSQVLGVHEIKVDGTRIQRALYLEARIRLSGPNPVEATYFEVLVLHPRAKNTDRQKGLLLLRTSADAQRHVCCKGQRQVGLANPIGVSLCSTCRACNYTVGSPATGRWAVLVRPPQLTGCPETLEVYALDRDFAMEFSAHPATATDPMPIKVALQMTRARLLRTAPGRGQLKPFRVGALDGWTTTLQTQDAHGKPRGWRLFGVQHGAVAFLMSVQAPPAQLKRQDATVRAVLDTFQIADPTRKSDAASILAGHPDIGGFKGNVLELPAIGLTLAGPDGWNKYQRTWQPPRFGWRCPTTSSSLTIAVQARCEASWTAAGTKQWIAAWARAYLRDKRFPGFRIDKAPVARKLAGHRAFFLTFHYRGKGRGPSRGFSWFVPYGRNLIVLHAEARPAPEQEAVLQQLSDRLAGLRLK